MMLGVQYYRPPFPDRGHWRPDMKRIAASGFDTVQLWACWGWIEPSPGEYRFEDYDELVEEASQAGLGVVISTIGEIQPFWIHRELPGCELVDHMGHAVVSSLRRECNVGLTPGACTDVPEVRARLGRFLEEIGRHYRDHKTLSAWDCWNETRWAVQADGHVCYCPATLGEYRSWLGRCYGGLEGLNDAWHRRYSAWEDVLPGKRPGVPYTDTVEFERFLTERSARHAAFRAERLKSADGEHPVFAHCGAPSVYSGGFDFEQAVSRGADADLARVLDGYGSSHFPVWQDMSAVELGTRIEAVASAVGSKPAWVSELQGGAACAGFGAWRRVERSEQQRWLWTAYGRGMKGVIIWCWRDEVFGRESSGFGIAGSDGGAEERLSGMTEAGRVLRAHDQLLEGYRPLAPEVGVVFAREGYQLDWAENGNDAEQARGCTVGWLELLERAQVPYRVVDSAYPSALEGLSLLVMPWPLIVGEDLGRAVEAWVRAGGTLIAETELGAFDERGFYVYPEERTLAGALGLRSQGRHPAGVLARLDLRLSSGHMPFQGSLPVEGWLETFDAGNSDVVAVAPHEGAVAVRRNVGNGTVIALGTLAGLGYLRSRDRGFEVWVRSVVEAACGRPAVSVSPDDGEVVQWRIGRSGESWLFFVTAESPVTAVRVRLAGDVLAESAAIDELIGHARVAEGAGLERTVVMTLSEDGVGVFRWEA
ncbi:MAG: beta-galactosidase [Actinomycetota bacterium]|nr:beta-galactosidase [Actinomycetota bacterium]